MSPKVAPSILSADFLNLGKDIEMLNRSEADWIHVDIMDGVFVPNISFGFPVLEAVASIAKKPLDVHLMITQPERYIEQFIKAGAQYLSIHFEGAIHLNRTIHQIKELGAKAGVVLNPHTSTDVLKDILPDLDFVLLMSVNPGYGGQKFIPGTLKKIESLNLLRRSRNQNCLIEVDGGVNEKNAQDIFEAGADVLVAGNAVFKAPDPEQVIKNLKRIS
jgi:ribulose-phosphate 3-epimerase